MSSFAPQIRKEFSKWLSLPNYDTVDIVAATYLANQLPGKAVWLAIVGPPATGKTEITQALSGCLNVHQLEGLTTASLVSGFKKTKTSDKHFGLLEQMQDGQPYMLVMKDFSAILQKRPEPRGEILARLRDLYDGEIRMHYGNDLDVSWKGKVGMIVCSTGQYDKEIKSLATMGDRFLVFRPRIARRKAICERATRNAGLTNEMRIDLEKAYSLLNKIKLPKGDIKISLEARTAISELSDFVTRARTPVSRDWRTHEVDDVPELEGTARVGVELCQLSKGLVLYHGMKNFGVKDVELLESLVFSTIPYSRSLVLSGMDLQGKVSGNQIAKDLELPQRMVAKCLEDLKFVGVVNWTGGDVRSPKGGWVVLKEWKPFVLRLRDWIEGREG